MPKRFNTPVASSAYLSDTLRGIGKSLVCKIGGLVPQIFNTDYSFITGEYTNIDSLNDSSLVIHYNYKTLVRGYKHYELSNHLGNVLAVISDKRITLYSSSVISGYEADVISASDYYPFGMLMSERSYSSPAYRYGFNGKEKIDEINGDGNSCDFGSRIYDSRLGRWLSLDPMMEKYPDLSPYNFCANNPIMFVDPGGKWIVPSDAFINSPYYSVLVQLTTPDKYTRLSNYIGLYQFNQESNLYLYYNYSQAITTSANTFTGIEKKGTKTSFINKTTIKFNSHNAAFSNNSKKYELVDGQYLEKANLSAGATTYYYANTLTKLGTASTIVHELIYHIGTGSRDHENNITIQHVEDFVTTIKQFASNSGISLTDEQAYTLALSGLPAPKQKSLVEKVNFSHGLTLTAQTVDANANKIERKNKFMTKEEYEKASLSTQDAQNKEVPKKQVEVEKPATSINTGGS